jgi:hypothetical protein
VKAKAIIAAALIAGALVVMLFCQIEAVERIASLENRQAYVFEIIRRRQLSPEICEGYSDGWMTCAMNAKKQCECNFEPDELDIANQIYAEAVKAAAAEIVAEKQAEEENAATEAD